MVSRVQNLSCIFTLQGIDLVMQLFCLFLCLVFSEVEGFQSRFTSLPPKPTVTHAGDNVTFVWYYHLSHGDTDRLQRLVFGLWHDGDISTSLITLSKNGSLSFHSERFLWLGSNGSAVCRLNNVTLADGRVYGMKLDFGAFTVRDFVRLVVIAPPRIKRDKRPVSQVSVSEGQSVIIPCDVTGYPPPWVSWARDGQIVQNSTRVSSLQVTSADQSMTGLYTCVARNQEGSDKHDVLLLVMSCQHEYNGGDERSDSKNLYSSTFTSTMVVVFVIFLIFAAYFFFRCAGAKSNAFRNYNRMPKEEQARSLMGEWSSFTDSGEKI